MKKLASLAVGVGLVAAPAVASANVMKVDLFVGRMKTPESCFVQVDLKTVEQDLFNGQETLKVGDQTVGTFQPLQSAGAQIAAGKSVLFGSPAFATEVGVQPDVSITDDQCKLVVPGAKFSLLGSFGPVAGELDAPNEFPALTVVGQALLISLEVDQFKLKWLGGEKTIGGGGASSGGASSGGASSGGASSGGTSSGGATSGGTSSGAPPASSSSDDGGCGVSAASPGAATGGGFALAVLGTALAALRRRRGSKR